MSFVFKKIKRELVVFPLIVNPIIFAVLAVVMFFIDNFAAMMITAVMGFLFFLNALFIFFKYGQNLTQKDLSKAVTGGGKVEDIRKWLFAPVLSSGLYYFVYIDGKKYLFREITGLQTGSAVEIKYLSKKNIVLDYKSVINDGNSANGR